MIHMIDLTFGHSFLHQDKKIIDVIHLKRPLNLDL